MRLLGAVTREDVLTALARGRDIASGSAPWTLRFIDQADAQFGGAWRACEIDAREAMALILPAHAGEPCQGDRLTLVSASGATVADAAKALCAIATDYARENPSCWSRIREAMDAPLSPIIATIAPLDTDEHRALNAPEPNARVGSETLYHLDGFHRLIGWTLAGRLTKDARLIAHVAGQNAR